MRRLPVIAAILTLAVLACGLTACCQDSTCIKDPPCKPCETPGCGK
jgi:hypothetical protein